MTARKLRKYWPILLAAAAIAESAHAPLMGGAYALIRAPAVTQSPASAKHAVESGKSVLNWPDIPGWLSRLIAAQKPKDTADAHQNPTLSRSLPDKFPGESGALPGLPAETEQPPISLLHTASPAVNPSTDLPTPPGDPILTSDFLPVVATGNPGDGGGDPTVGEQPAATPVESAVPAPVSVPEPAMIGLLTLGTWMLVGRRNSPVSFPANIFSSAVPAAAVRQTRQLRST